MELFINYPSGNTSLNITKRGKKIFSVKVEDGYNKRNIIEICRQKGPLKSIPFIERLDPYNSMHYATCFCLMVEKAAGVSCDQNLQFIRTVFLEMERIFSHVVYLDRMFRASDNSVFYNITSSVKEMIIDLKEEITGHRLYSSAQAFGCLNFNFSQGNLKQIGKSNNDIKIKLNEMEDLLNNNEAIESVYSGVAIIKDVDSCPGFSGPFSWMNGKGNDARLGDPYLAYSDNNILDIIKNKYTSDYNCAFSRIKAIIQDIKASIDVITHITGKDELTYQISNRFTDDIKAPHGTHGQNIETPRGFLQMQMDIDKNGNIEALDIISPSDKNQKIVNSALRGGLQDHVCMAWESLYISMMEIDK